MKRIDKLLKVQNENKKSTILPQNAECMEMSLHPIQAVYGNAQSFALRFNPSEQITCAANIEKVLMGEAPKIRELKEVYSIELLEVWIMAQIENLNDYVGVKSKMEIYQMRDLAAIILNKCDYLNASEVLIFFYKLKAGEFGSFYGVIDPQKVGEFLNNFFEWRREEFFRVKNENEQAVRQEKLRVSQRKAITREEYERGRAIHPRAEPAL